MNGTIIIEFMYVRKHRSALQSNIEKQNIGREMNQQGVNHQFFLLVRDRKYEEALRLGQMYLRYHPHNTAIANFCTYIEKNKAKLLKMVDEEDNYTEASREQSEGSEDDSQDEDSEDSDSEEEESELESQKSKIVSEKTTNCSLPSIAANKRPNNQASRTSLTSVLSKHTIPVTKPRAQVSKTPSQTSLIKPTTLFLNIENRQGKYCQGHTWNHNCKNNYCPNKK